MALELSDDQVWGGDDGGQGLIPAAGGAPGDDFVRRIQHQENPAMDPNAVSPAGARGLMQVEDATTFNPGYGVAPARNNSPAERTRVGVDYAKAMRSHFGDETLGAAAYDLGPGAVQNLIDENGDPRRGEISMADFVKSLPKETQNYVQNVAPATGVKGELTDQQVWGNQPKEMTDEQVWGPQPKTAGEELTAALQEADKMLGKGPRALGHLATPGAVSRIGAAGLAAAEEAATPPEELYGDFSDDTNALLNRFGIHPYDKKQPLNFAGPALYAAAKASGIGFGLIGSAFNAVIHGGAAAGQQALIEGGLDRYTAARIANTLGQMAEYQAIKGEAKELPHLPETATQPAPEVRPTPAPEPPRTATAATVQPQRPSPPPPDAGLGQLGLLRPGEPPPPTPEPVATPAPAPLGPVLGDIPRRNIREDTVVTATGRQVPVVYAVVDADHLTPSQRQDGTVNPAFPAELQPRDRTRAVSQQQIAQISQNLNPRLLGFSPTASDGAPIVSPDGVVESGNGRTLAIQRAYDDNSASAANYRQDLVNQGFDVSGMRAPMLVRVRNLDMTPDQRQAFIREANQSGVMGYSATEQARADAAALPDDVLGYYRGGDIDAAANQDFVRQFASRALTPGEYSNFVTADGQMSQDAIRRVQAALVAKAYDDPHLVSTVAESPDSDIRAIGGALSDMAPHWAQFRADVARGDVPADMDLTQNLLAAAKLVEHARATGRNVAEFVAQPDMLTGKTIDPMTEAWLRLMFRNTKDWTRPVGRKALADSIKMYVGEARNAGGLGLASMAPADILALARERLTRGGEGGEPGSAGNVPGVREAGGQGTGAGTQGAAEAGGGQTPEARRKPRGAAEGSVKFQLGPRNDGLPEPPVNPKTGKPITAEPLAGHLAIIRQLGREGDIQGLRDAVDFHTEKHMLPHVRGEQSEVAAQYARDLISHLGRTELRRRHEEYQRHLGEIEDLFKQHGRVIATDPRAPNRRILLTVDPSGDGKYRVTSFDGDVPTGHRVYDSIKDAQSHLDNAGAEFVGMNVQRPAPKPFATEPGAVDARGKPLPQMVIPGTERSAQQAAAARGERIAPKVGQKEAGGLFAGPEKQGSLFERGRGPQRMEGGAVRQAISDDIVAHLPVNPSRAEAEVIDRVQRIAQRIVPKARVIPARRITTHGEEAKKDAGQVAHGVFVPGARRLIAWALTSPDAESSMRHEAVHWLRGAGFFTPSEWKALERAALQGDWIGEHNIASRYAAYDPAIHTEEAIADHYGQWRRAPETIPAPIRPIFEKLYRLLARVGDYLRKAYGADTSVADIFSRIESGEIGSRGKIEPTGTPTFGKRGAHFQLGPEDLPEALQEPARSATDLVHSVRMVLTPMAEGSESARATVKDWANRIRLARWHGGRMDQMLAKDFTPEQRKRMWEAADEESVLRQTGQSTEGAGLSRLTPAERDAVLGQQRDAQATWEAARAVGLVQDEGLPSYVPRMFVDVSEGGKPLRGGEGRSIPGFGRQVRTSTPQMKQRKHLTTEESEAAASEKFQTEAVVIKDIRTLPLATMRLREAVAGRALINAIKELGRQAGEDTVVEGATPQDPEHRWFTIDNPAFTTWRPKFVRDEETGKIVAQKDENGNTVFERVPVQVRDDFEGPLRSVLSNPDGPIYNAFMDLKGRAMNNVMFSPFVQLHLLTELGRSFPAAPLKTATLKILAEGNAARNDPGTMTRAILAGMVPVGRHFEMQDISGMTQAEQIRPGRSWTAKVAGFIPGLFDQRARQSVYRTIDAMGNFLHNTLLWDRVADLQAGLFTTFADDLRAKGFDPTTADRIAAHWANRYAGTLPREAMSQLSRKLANIMLFSRTYTLGNLGVVKDMVTGLPRDVQAQITRDAGTEALQQVKSLSRRKTLAIVAIDIGLMYAANSLLQNAFAYWSGRETGDQILQGYIKRMSDLGTNIENFPLRLLDVFGALDTVSATATNETDPQTGRPLRRVLIGYDKQGTAIYARNPLGKFAEEYSNWVEAPIATLKSKLSPFARPTMDLISNDDGLGKKIYQPSDSPEVAIAKVIGSYIKAMLPMDQIDSAYDILMGQARSTDAAKLALRTVGVTVRRGYPGGPAAGFAHEVRSQHEQNIQEQLPDIHKQFDAGDRTGAAQALAKLGMTARERVFLLRSWAAPSSRARLPRYATPEQRDKLRDIQGATTP